MKDRYRPFDATRAPGRAQPDPQHEPMTFVQQLLVTARHEVPAPELEDRVLSAIAYNTRLASAPQLQLVQTSQRKSRVTAAALSFAVAASALLWWRVSGTHKAPLVAPEHTMAGAPSIAAAPTNSGKSPPNPCLRRVVAAGHRPLIDDFEDGDDAVLSAEGRAGFWRWARDTDAPNSAPALLPNPRLDAGAANHWAIHVKGGRLLEWGAVVEFNFNPACYDASVYQGLSFQAKGPGRVFVAPREVGTIPQSEGGTCLNDCYNPHVKKVELDRQWKTYRIEWHEFEQRGYGRPPVDPKQLHSIAFLIRIEDTPYDLWFDDVSFLPTRTR